MDKLVENTLINYEKYKTTNFPKILDPKEKIVFIKELLNLDYKKNLNNSYKFENYYILFQNIIEFINENYNELKDNDLKYLITSSNIISCITMMNKGQNLLYIFNNNLVKILDNDKCGIMNYLILSSSHGTLCTFIFWLKFLKFNNINEIDLTNLQLIVQLSIQNPDDRIYKYLLHNLNKNIFVSKFVKEMLILIGKISMKKHILIKLKILNKYINLNDYINYFLINTYDYKIIFKLYKHYTIKYDFELLNYLMDQNDNYFDNCNSIYNILISNIDQNMFNILYVLKYNRKINDFKINKNIIIDNYILLIELFSKTYLTFIKINQNKIYSDLIKIFVENNLINKYLETKQLSNQFRHLYLYTRFYSHTYNYIIKNNLLLHYLRLTIKFRRNKKIKMHQFYMYNLLNEILNFEPNVKKKILSKGSYLYQLKKQEFKHSYNLNSSVNYSNCLIHKKYFNEQDTILVRNIPINVFPNNYTINNFEIKAEYIEKLDLYFIIDINIPNTTQIDRYIKLRNLHTYTKNDIINNINKIEDLDDILKKEEIILNNFLNDNKNLKWFPKWYPKLMCYIENEILITQNNFNIINL